MCDLHSWGRFPGHPQQALQPQWMDEMVGILQQARQQQYTLLPFGLGRSYGDSCLNGENRVISSAGLNRFISFDPTNGILRCEAGVTLAEILSLIIPQGWFLPVTPGTKFVTVGGAIANDVHGKNHHCTGSFGNHITLLALQRSDGNLATCSPDENTELFNATIGGLGLTGVITWAELSLKRITSSALQVENIRYNNLSDFFQLSEDSTDDYEYTVAWIDCLARGKSLGRGHFIRGNHAPANTKAPMPSAGKLNVPITPPVSLINRLSLRLFNTAYYHRQPAYSKRFSSGYDPFFYPLDGIHNWNRVYGRKGFQQYQCVVPPEHAQESISEILQQISHAGFGSFLAVLKIFGDKPSRGLLSFPRPGATLALDFPRDDRRSPALFNQLDKLVHQAGGAIYPAKDSHTAGHYFRAAYPQWQQLEQLRDPAINSRFWQRLTEDTDA